MLRQTMYNYRSELKKLKIALSVLEEDSEQRRRLQHRIVILEARIERALVQVEVKAAASETSTVSGVLQAHDVEHLEDFSPEAFERRAKRIKQESEARLKELISSEGEEKQT